MLLRARLIGGLPADLVGSLTGLTQGHFPVHANARYADDLSAADAKAKAKDDGTATVTEDSDPNRRAVDIYAKSGSPVIAVQDGTVISQFQRDAHVGSSVGQRQTVGDFRHRRQTSGRVESHTGRLAAKRSTCSDLAE